MITQSELELKQAKHLIDNTEATDAHGNTFEWEKTYFYEDRHEIKSVRTKYNCLALRILDDGSVLYSHRKHEGLASAEVIIATSKMYLTAKDAIPAALLKIEGDKERALIAIENKIKSELSAYTDLVESLEIAVQKLKSI